MEAQAKQPGGKKKSGPTRKVPAECVQEWAQHKTAEKGRIGWHAEMIGQPLDYVIIEYNVLYTSIVSGASAYIALQPRRLVL